MSYADVVRPRSQVCQIVFLLPPRGVSLRFLEWMGLLICWHDEGVVDRSPLCTTVVENSRYPRSHHRVCLFLDDWLRIIQQVYALCYLKVLKAIIFGGSILRHRIELNDPMVDQAASLGQQIPFAVFLRDLGVWWVFYLQPHTFHKEGWKMLNLSG
jgi:hypothetical protein